MAFEHEGGPWSAPPVLYKCSRRIRTCRDRRGAAPRTTRKRAGARGPPPSWSSLGDGERDIERLRPALEEHGDPVARLQSLGGALEVWQGPDSLAVDLADDVAALQSRLGGRAVLVHPRHQHAFGRAQIELAGDLRSQGPRIQPQEALALAALLGRLGGFIRRLADLDLKGLLALVAPDLDGHPLAGGGHRHDLLEILGGVHLLAVEFGQDIAGGQTRLVGRA